MEDYHIEAEQLGLAAYVVLNAALDELEKTHPGIKERAKQTTKAGLLENPGPNTAKIVHAIDGMA